MNFDAERERAVFPWRPFLVIKLNVQKGLSNVLLLIQRNNFIICPIQIQRIHELLKILLFGVHTTEKQFAMTFLSVS